MVFTFPHGLSESLKQPSKLSIPREDKPTQDDLLDDPVLENPLFEKKCLPRMRQMCWWEDKALCHFVWDIMVLISPPLERERNHDSYLVLKLLCLFKKAWVLAEKLCFLSAPFTDLNCTCSVFGCTTGGVDCNLYISLLTPYDYKNAFAYLGKYASLLFACSLKWLQNFILLGWGGNFSLLDKMRLWPEWPLWSPPYVLYPALVFQNKVN